MATETAGTVLAPRWYESFADVNGDECVHSKLYSYVEDGQLTVGTTKSVMFTVDRPASEVWPVLKDFNLWQAEYGHHYSGVVGPSGSAPSPTTADLTSTTCCA